MIDSILLLGAKLFVLYKIAEVILGGVIVIATLAIIFLAFIIAYKKSKKV